MTQLTFKRKILALVLVILVCGAGAGWVLNQSSNKFVPSQVSSFLPYHPEWDVPFTKDQERSLHQALGQPFHYLAAGSQSFAFLSQDGKYVIKFFRSPPLGNTKKSIKRREKLEAALAIYHMAYEEFRDDAGLLFVHLNPTHRLQKTVMVVTASGKEYLIDLDRAPFIIQERAELIFDRFKKLVEQGDAQGLKRSVTAVLDLVERRIDKGLTDDDKAVTHNYGFVGDRAVHFDIGRVCKGAREGEYETVAKRIDKWLLEDAEK